MSFIDWLIVVIPTLLIVGVGINVLHQDFPAELAGIATSLEDHAPPPDRASLAAALIRRFFEPAEREKVMRAYRERLVGVGETVRVITARGERNAVLLGVTDEGFLQIQNDAGSEEILSSGEISIRF